MLKSKFETEKVSIKIGLFFCKFGLTPNQWTCISLVFAIFGFSGLYYHNLLFASIFFLISGFVDVIDGAVARVMGSATNYGAFMDGIVDRYVEMLLYFGLLIYSPPEFMMPIYYWISLLIFGAVMTSFVRAYADHRRVITEAEDQRKMGGLLERTERLMLIFAGMFMGFLFNELYLSYIIAIAVILSNITAFQRIWFVIMSRNINNK